MARLMVIRPIYPLPGRHEETIRWFAETEPIRRRAGQVAQYFLRNVVDSSDYEFVQVWQDRQTYERWRETPERAELAVQRQRYFTHDPTRLFEVIA